MFFQFSGFRCFPETTYETTYDSGRGVQARPYVSTFPKLCVMAFPRPIWSIDDHPYRMADFQEAGYRDWGNWYCLGYLQSTSTDGKLNEKFTEAQLQAFDLEDEARFAAWTKQSRERSITSSLMVLCLLRQSPFWYLEGVAILFSLTKPVTWLGVNPPWLTKLQSFQLTVIPLMGL